MHHSHLPRVPAQVAALINNLDDLAIERELHNVTAKEYLSSALIDNVQRRQSVLGLFQKFDVRVAVQYSLGRQRFFVRRVGGVWSCVCVSGGWREIMNEVVLWVELLTLPWDESVLESCAIIVVKSATTA